MTAQYTQYRPISSTRLNNPADVRSAWELAAGVNNYVRYVANFKLVSHLYLPGLSSMCREQGTFPDQIMQIPVFWNGCYNYVRYWVSGKLTTGTAAGGDSTEWTIYLTAAPAGANQLFDVETTFGSATFSVESEVRAPHTGTFAVSPSNAYRQMYCILCASDKAIDVRAKSELYSLDLQPIIVT